MGSSGAIDLLLPNKDGSVPSEGKSTPPRAVQPRLVEAARFPGHTDRVDSVAVSPDGRLILSGSSDHTMRLWDRESGRMVRRFPGHFGRVMSVAFSPDGRRTLSGGEDKIIRLWDLRTGGLLRELKGHADWLMPVAFSPDGKLAYSTSGASGVGSDGTDFGVRVWDVETGQQVGKMEGHKKIVWGLSVSPDGRRILTERRHDHSLGRPEPERDPPLQQARRPGRQRGLSARWPPSRVVRLGWNDPALGP